MQTPPNEAAEAAPLKGQVVADQFPSDSPLECVFAKVDGRKAPQIV